MLSVNLDALAGHFSDWSRGAGVQLNAEGCAHIACLLRELAVDARALEGATVPLAARGAAGLRGAAPEAADNVVAMAEHPAVRRRVERRRVTSSGPFGPGGGAA